MQTLAWSDLMHLDPSMVDLMDVSLSLLLFVPNVACILLFMWWEAFLETLVGGNIEIDVDLKKLEDQNADQLYSSHKLKTNKLKISRQAEVTWKYNQHKQICK